jgi:putative ABC transport system permease protein
MLRNYLTVALRNLRKHAGYTLINSTGLGVAFAVTIVFGLVATKILSWDAFHEHADQIYLVESVSNANGDGQPSTSTWAPTLDALTRTHPKVRGGTRVEWRTHQVQVDGTTIEQTIQYADSSFFEVFTFPLVRGDPATVLDRKSAAVMSEDAAEKYFPNSDPVGQTLTLDGASELVVTGVAENPPVNTRMRFDVVANFAHAETHVESVRDWHDEWRSTFLQTYVRLREGTDPAALERQLPSFLETQLGAERAEKWAMNLVALPEVYDRHAGIDTYAYLLLAMALGMLGMAAINVTNLATARSLKRAREVGVRKAIGARRSGLAGQFLVESTVLGLVALVPGVLLAQIAIPSVGTFLDLPVTLDLGEPLVWGVLLGLAVVVGLLAGGYPAFFLSRFQPARVLKGDLSRQPGGQWLRRGLVVGQFTIAAVLLAGTVGLWQQMDFMRQRAQKQLQLDGVVQMEVSVDPFGGAEQAWSKLRTVRRELERLPDVAHVSVSSGVPGAYRNIQDVGLRPGDANQPKMRATYVDEEYFDVYNLQLVAGHGFREATETEKERGVVVNQAAVRHFGWDSFRGKVLYQGDTERPVIGVVEDYHYKSLREPIEPTIHKYAADAFGAYSISVRAAGPPSQALIADLRTAWTELGLPVAFDYTFGDQRFDGIPFADQKMATLVQYSALIAILIALLGLMGIVSLSVVQRTKEIGIRKALGAPVRSIVGLLTKDFALLVGGALVLGLPLAYWGLSTYLQTFAYRVDLGVGPFVGTCVAMFGLAFLAMSYHTLKAARTDPATTLRDE